MSISFQRWRSRPTLLDEDIFSYITKESDRRIFNETNNTIIYSVCDQPEVINPINYFMAELVKQTEDLESFKL